MIADRAGEEYLEVANDASTARGFAEIVRADVITLLVDGHRLLDAAARQNLRSELEMMLQALKDGDALAPTQRLAIALAKLDEIESSANKNRAEADFSRLVDSIRTLFSGSFAVIEAFRLAAFPTSDALPRGHGVSDLLAFWMAARSAQTAALRSAEPPSRAFGRLTPTAG